MRISDWSSDVCSSDLRQVYEQVWAWSLQDTVCGGEKFVRPAGDRKSPSVPVGAGPAKRATSRAVIALAGRSIPTRRSEEHTSELQSLMRTSYAVFCLKKKKRQQDSNQDTKYDEVSGLNEEQKLTQQEKRNVSK